LALSALFESGLLTFRSRWHLRPRDRRRGTSGLRDGAVRNSTVRNSTVRNSTVRYGAVRNRCRGGAHLGEEHPDGGHQVVRPLDLLLEFLQRLIAIGDSGQPECSDPDQQDGRSDQPDQSDGYSSAHGIVGATSVEAVADPPDRDEAERVAQLLAELADVDINGAIVTDPPVAPHVVEELATAEDETGVGAQVSE